MDLGQALLRVVRRALSADDDFRAPTTQTHGPDQWMDRIADEAMSPRRSAASAEQHRWAHATRAAFICQMPICPGWPNVELKYVTIWSVVFLRSTGGGSRPSSSEPHKHGGVER